VIDLGLEESVVFESWQKDLASYYKTADVFVLTSYYEGFGLTLAEAVACGCPIVSTDVGIARDLLGESGLGKVCPVNDLDCFVSSLYFIYKDSSIKELAKSSGSSVVADLFPESEDKYFEKYKADWHATVK
jgi:glycosyltransferase involved in cell wall biosynthesis